MHSEPAPSIVRRMIIGWERVFGFIAAVAFFLFGGAAIAAIIVLPLWAAATRAPRVYAATIGIVLFGSLVVWGYRRIRAGRAASSPRHGRRRAIAARTAAALLGAYGTALVFVWLPLWVAAATIVAYLGFLGIAFGGKQTRP